MATPGQDESQDEFIARCIPIVVEDGTAEDGEQANAVCHSMWAQAKEAAGATVGGDGVDAAPDAQPADTTQPVRESLVVEARIEPAQGEPELQGIRWDVTIIGAGKRPGDLVIIGDREFVRSLNDKLYSTEALIASVPFWDGARVYDNHLTNEEFKDRGGMRSVAGEWMGTIIKPWWEAESRQLHGIFNVVEASLAAKLKAAWDSGVLDTVGLSIDTFPTYGQDADVEGQSLPTIEGFDQIVSVDIVARPAAGGGFNRLLAAEQQTQTTEEFQMDEKEIQAMIDRAVAEALAETDTETETEAVEEEPETAPVAEVQGEQTPQAPEPVITDLQPQPAGGIGDAALRQMACRLMLRDKLEEARLPVDASKLVRDAFDNRIFESSDLDTYIAQVRGIVATRDPSGQVSGAGGRSAVVSVFDERDMQEVAFMKKVMWDSEFRALEGIEEDWVKERVPEAYTSWIRNGRPTVSRPYRLSELVIQILGGNPFDVRASEAVTTTNMSSIVKNTVNILLANDYAQRQKWWGPLVRTEVVDTIDTATLVRVFGLSTLDIVNEGAPYTEMTWVDEEETATFIKRGNYVGVTIESMLAEKINVIRTLPSRLATSWHNTISLSVSNVFTVNSNAGPVLTTTGALFNATAVTSTGGHANLLTAPLSFSAYGTARTAMMKQTDQVLGTGQRLIIQPRFLVAPVDLEPAANQIRNSENEPGVADNDINPHYQRFDVIVNPHETDTNNWVLVADPQQFPAIWLIFLRGLQAPAIFEAGDESSGAMFTNDTLRYKVRLMTWRFSSTYDCAPVSDFRPLHKNNVA